jgi:hypothetical protein
VELIEEKQAKVKTFEDLEFFQGQEKKKSASSGGSTIAIRSTTEGDLDRWFSCPGRSRRSAST